MQPVMTLATIVMPDLSVFLSPNELCWAHIILA